MTDTIRKVLVVDDEPINIKIISNILKDEYEVLAAVDGAQAIKVTMQQQPDIILLDMMMPGMNGIEVCEQIKKNRATRDIPVLFVTVLDDMNNEEIGFKAGAADYITKPVHPHVLKARIQIHIDYSHYVNLLEGLLAKGSINSESVKTEAKFLLED